MNKLFVIVSFLLFIILVLISIIIRPLFIPIWFFTNSDGLDEETRYLWYPVIAESESTSLGYWKLCWLGTIRFYYGYDSRHFDSNTFVSRKPWSNA